MIYHPRQCNYSGCLRLLLSDLTSAAAVQAALDEYERLGKEVFLRTYGYREASSYLVRNPRTQGLADSKAIAGVALAHQYPGSGGLSAADFSGGANTVQRQLERLGFEVITTAGSGGGADWLEALLPLHYLFTTGLELPRADFKAMSGLGDRLGTALISSLLKREFLSTSSPYGPLRFAIPQHALRFYFPALWPEAEQDAMAG